MSALFLLGIHIEMVYQMSHYIMRQRAMPCLGAPLRCYQVLDRRYLVQQIKGLDAGNKFPFHEGLRNGRIQHKIIGVHISTSVAAAAVHVTVRCYSQVEAWNSVARRQTIAEIASVQCPEIAHAPFAVSPHDVGRGADVVRFFVVLDVYSVVKGKSVHGAYAAFRLAGEHRVVQKVTVARICVHLPRPASLVANKRGNVIFKREVVGSADIHRLVGVHSGPGSIRHRLRLFPVFVIEHCAGMHLTGTFPEFESILGFRVRP